MDLGQGSCLEGPACFVCFKARSFCYTSSPLFSPSSSFSLSLSCGFRLDWVFADCDFLRRKTDIKNDFADCNFLRCGERLY